MNFIRKTKELLLAHTSMQRVTLSKSVNVMLTPQFYTLKKEELPVKYAYQAKKIAPSLFEGLLEDGGTYDYMVFKERDAWVFIAYDIERIRKFLQSKGIAIEKISKLFFAQQSVNSFTTPLSLSDKESLAVIDDTVVVVPSIALSDKGQSVLVFDEKFTPKEGGFSIKGTTKNSMITQTQALSLAAIFMLFAGIFMVEGSRYTGENQVENEELQSLYEEYPALENTSTRKNIIDKYKNIDSAERKKRDVIKSLSKMIFKGVTLNSVAMNEKSFKAQFSCIDNDVAKRVKKLAKKLHYNTSKVKNSTDLTVEGTL